MRKIIKYGLGILVTALLFGFSLNQTAEKKYKCMVQMSNYYGEGAYIAVSVLNAKNQYVKTLQVFGDDDEWHAELKQWWKANKENKSLTSVDAISGETLAGGERQIFSLSIDEAYMNKGYSLRFESAVEENGYHSTDVVIPLSNSSLKEKHEGKGFIRYVRLIPTSK